MEVKEQTLFQPASLGNDLSPEQQRLFVTLAPRFKRDGLVKSLLIATGLSQKEIARRHGLIPSEVSKVILGARKTRHIREAIAQELGLKTDELWKE